MKILYKIILLTPQIYILLVCFCLFQFNVYAQTITDNGLESLKNKSQDTYLNYLENYIEDYDILIPNFELKKSVEKSIAEKKFFLNAVIVKNTFRFQFQWNHLGHLTEKMFYTWNNQSKDWNLMTINTYKYNSVGEKTNSEYKIRYHDDGLLNKYKLEEWDYDDYGNILEYKEHIWSKDDAAYIPQNKSVYSYSHENQLSSKYSYKWNSNLGSWNNYYKMIQLFNTDGKDKITETFYWDNTSEVWHAYSKQVLIIDSIANTRTATSFDWNNSINQWDTLTHSFFIYDNNNLIESTFYKRCTTNNKLYVDYKIIWFFNSESQMIKSYLYTGSPNMDGITKYLKTTNEYDEIGNISETIRYRWNVSQESWLELEKTHYEYDFDGNFIQFVKHNWNTQLNDWVKNQKRQNILDYAGNQTMYSELNWNEQLNSWDTIYIRENSFNLSYDVEELLLPDDSELYEFSAFDYSHSFSYGNKMLMQSNNRRFDSNNTIEKYEILYFYTEITEENNKLIDVYPVPTDSYLNISLNSNCEEGSFTVFDIHGRLVLEKQITGSTYINLGNLPSGLYLYNVIFCDKTESGKLIRN